MPALEALPVTVQITVQVDGHTLTFEETGKATGARYHGTEPPRNFSNSVLELNVQGTVDTCIARATKHALAFVANAYPTA